MPTFTKRDRSDQYDLEEGTLVEIAKEYGGGTGTVVDPRDGNFIVVKTKKGNQSFHSSDVRIIGWKGASFAASLGRPIVKDAMLRSMKAAGKSASEIAYECSLIGDADVACAATQDVAVSWLSSDKDAVVISALKKTGATISDISKPFKNQSSEWRGKLVSGATLKVSGDDEKVFNALAAMEKQFALMKFTVED